MSAPLIIGAGPAGIRAAATLVAAGLRPMVVDEAHAAGGQIYRQPWQPDGRPASALYGSEAGKAHHLHQLFTELIDRIDYHPNTLVWGLRDGQADILHQGGATSIAYDGLILATGATDRILPLPGWTLPGVFTLGAAQIALKAQGCAIGRRPVFIGSGPLLYLVAWQYLQAGVRPVAVLDTAPLAAKHALLRGLSLAPAIILRGLGYGLALRRAGVPIHTGVSDVQFQGRDRVDSITWCQGKRQRHLACDGIGYGLGLRPETQLADLAGCAFVFDERDRGWRPHQDGAGRASVPGVYLAGDGAGIAGADAAEISGEHAAWSLLTDRGQPAPPARLAHLTRARQHIDRLRTIFAAAFPFPSNWITKLADDTLLCRCEEVRVGDIRAAIDPFDLRDLNRLKAITRTGMGRCQGRLCAAAAAELLADHRGCALSAVGRLRGQAPVKPIPLAEAAE